MPIYEFYCRECHTIYNFFARSVNTEKIPKCPKGHRNKLQRQMSRFAISKGRSESQTESDMSDIDEAKMEQAMMQMAGDFENVNEEDPRAMASMMPL